MDFNKAYNHLVAKIDPEKAFVPKAERIEKKQRLTAQQRTMSLQEQLKKGLDPHCKNAIAYLIQVRKIDPSIVFEFVNKRMMLVVNIGLAALQQQLRETLRIVIMIMVGCMSRR